MGGHRSMFGRARRAIRRIVLTPLSLSYARAAAMRSMLQIVLVLVVIMGSVFGLTFINQYKVETEEPPIKGMVDPSPDAGVNLILPVKIVEWDPESAGEREVHKEGHWDFWFENRKDVAVEMGLQAKS